MAPIRFSPDEISLKYPEIVNLSWAKEEKKENNKRIKIRGRKEN